MDGSLLDEALRRTAERLRSTGQLAPELADRLVRKLAGGELRAVSDLQATLGREEGEDHEAEHADHF